MPKIDNKKEERAKLKDQQFDLMNQKSKSDLKLATLRSNVELEQERISSNEKTIYELSNKILASGVPEGIYVETEKLETEKAI